MNLEEWPLTGAWPEEELVNLEQLNKKTLSFQPWDIPVPIESYPRFLFKRFNFSIILAGLLFEDYRTPPK